MSRDMHEAPIPSPPWSMDRLGERIERMFRRFLLGSLNAARATLRDVLSAGIELVLEAIEDSVARQAGPILDEILEVEELPESYRSYLDELRHPTSQGAAVGLAGMASGLGMGAASALLAPAMRWLNYGMDKQMRTARADPAQAHLLKWRHPEAAFHLEQGLKELGWQDDVIDAWEASVRPRLDESSLWRAVWLGAADRGEVVAELVRRGYLGADVRIMRDLSRFRPGPSDLISMGVREAWRDDVAARWGYDEDFPAELREEMRKLGDTENWSQKYWRAHWDLPSVTMALEMLHRGVVSEAEFREFLRIADIPSEWRERIFQIAYTPYTRVDVRRMFQLGVLDRSDVFQSYKDVGYDNEHAENMTRFTEAYVSEEDRELTKADILSGFKTGVLTEAEATDWLEAIGYGAGTAGYLVAREAAELARDLTDDEIDIIEDLYVARDITRTQATNRLTALGLAASEIERHFASWDIAYRARIERPSRAQYDEFLMKDLVGEAAYRRGLEALGYQGAYIELFLDATLADKAEAARKEEEAARKEQENIRHRRLKSDYQIAKAQLDVDMAEVRTAIAETQEAIRARRQRMEEEIEVARGALTVAELEQRAADDIAALEADIRALRDAQAVLRSSIEENEATISAIRLDRAEYQERLAIRLAEASVDELVAMLEAEREARELEYDRLIEEQRTAQAPLREDVERLQTQIAEARLAWAEYLEEVSGWIAAAADEAEIEEIEAEAETQKLASDRQIRELQVALESVQDRIEEYDSDIEALRLERAEYREAIEEEIATATAEDARAAIRQEAEAQELAFTRRVRALQADVAQAETDVDDAARQIAETQGQIAQRRVQLRHQIDVVARLRSVEAIRAEGEAAIAVLQERLAELRINLSELKEAKAALEVGYREAVAP